MNLVRLEPVLVAVFRPPACSLEPGLHGLPFRGVDHARQRAPLRPGPRDFLEGVVPTIALHAVDDGETAGAYAGRVGFGLTTLGLEPLVFGEGGVHSFDGTGVAGDGVGIELEGRIHAKGAPVRFRPGQRLARARAGGRRGQRLHTRDDPRDLLLPSIERETACRLRFHHRLRHSPGPLRYRLVLRARSHGV